MKNQQTNLTLPSDANSNQRRQIRRRHPAKERAALVRISRGIIGAPKNKTDLLLMLLQPAPLSIGQP